MGNRIGDFIGELEEPFEPNLCDPSTKSGELFVQSLKKFITSKNGGLIAGAWSILNLSTPRNLGSGA